MILKWIALIVLGMLVFWFLRRTRQIQQKDDPRLPVIEDMVCCAHCGVHLPKSECVSSQDKYFCSVEHHKQYLQARMNEDK